MGWSAVAALDQGWSNFLAAGCSAAALVLVAVVGRKNNKASKRAAAAATEAVDQLTPNSGNSTRDAVTRIEKKVDRLIEDQAAVKVAWQYERAEIHARLNMLEGRIR